MLWVQKHILKCVEEKVLTYLGTNLTVLSNDIPMEKIEYGYPHSNALLQFCLKLERCKPHKALRHPTKSSNVT